MAKDRHRPGYWKERYQKLKKEGKLDKTDRHRPGYYREYNLKHPERLERIGIGIKSKLTRLLEDKERRYTCDEDEM